ncbi:hypothetical protein B0I27_104319 [Arcticibacter pallidicorallinus]|uniref:Uncharacterized protein n=1 Tax=Arcticibacter pallidicorallinus TaxID=1259464 RepID=A0A2T0U5W9_9SPHI|nr:hypothetical protein [Arcticibacter pallidicorallinus]PRY53309.1 hypothetical protein B0I27_104319 [Arcticibacter pallidicorallinus]
MEELRKNWAEDSTASRYTSHLDKASLHKILRLRANKQMKINMQYFWASFALQVIVYSYLTHVIIKHWNDSLLIFVGILCILIYIPFTIILLKKFKKIASLRSGDQHAAGLPIQEYIQKHQRLLSSFYKFKSTYEIMLVILSTAIMTWMVFRIYIPGGVIAHPAGASFIFITSLLCCTVAIHAENKKHFKDPLTELQKLLNEFKQ